MNFEWPHEVDEFIESRDSETRAELEKLLREIARELTEEYDHGEDNRDYIRVGFVKPDIYVYYRNLGGVVEVPNIGLMSDLPALERGLLCRQRDAVKYNGPYLVETAGTNMMCGWPLIGPLSWTRLSLKAASRSTVGGAEWAQHKHVRKIIEYRATKVEYGVSELAVNFALRAVTALSTFGPNRPKR